MTATGIFRGCGISHCRRATAKARSSRPGQSAAEHPRRSGRVYAGPGPVRKTGPYVTAGADQAWRSGSLPIGDYIRTHTTPAGSQCAYRIHFQASQASSRCHLHLQLRRPRTPYLYTQPFSPVCLKLPHSRQRSFPHHIYHNGKQTGTCGWLYVSHITVMTFLRCVLRIYLSPYVGLVSHIPFPPSPSTAQDSTIQSSLLSRHSCRVFPQSHGHSWSYPECSSPL